MNEEMKNQTEQLPLLKVHMMGSFFLEYGDQPISFRKTMATKSMRLLQIFLYNKDNGISRGRTVGEHIRKRRCGRTRQTACVSAYIA